MEKRHPKWLRYWLKVVCDAWEEWSWLEMFGEALGGLIVIFVLHHFGIAEPGHAFELIAEEVGCAATVPSVGFLFRLFFVSAPRLSEQLETRLESLEEKLKPKFVVACGPGIRGCINPVLDKAIFYRLQVQTNGANEIENCIGYLTKVEKDGSVLFDNESLELPFAPSESADALKKTIFPNVPCYLDVLMIVVSGRLPVQVASRSERSLVVRQMKDLVFLGPGEYILYVSVSGKGVPTVHVKLKFHWEKDPVDSTIEKLDS